MGILADVFVSTPEDAANYEQSMLARTRDEHFTYVEYKGVTSLEFGQLIAILEGVPFDQKTHEFSLIWETEGALIEQFSSDAVSLLSSLTAESLISAAERWCEIEELRCSSEALEPILADLQRLARLARETDKGMYIYNSV